MTPNVLYVNLELKLQRWATFEKLCLDHYATKQSILHERLIKAPPGGHTLINSLASCSLLNFTHSITILFMHIWYCLFNDKPIHLQGVWINY